MSSELTFIQIPPEHIVTIKFLLESYEGLAILRTLDAERGHLVLISTSDQFSELQKLLENLTTQLSLRIIPPPDSAHQDWLVAEYLKG